MTRLETASQFLAALDAKDIDGAVACMNGDPTLTTPMGTKQGVEKVRGMLGVIANMGGGNASEPTEEGESVTAIASSPMGKVKLTFTFDGSTRIERLEAKLGG